jgi:L-alanine-DL-glutamate epimerase-like enolase superfamily enzyme
VKITGIRTEAYRWPRAKPITNGKHTDTHVELSFVKIEKDEGITGIGLGEGAIIGRATVE